MSVRAAVVYPFPNLHETGWGNSLRASLLIRYLAERAASVQTFSVSRAGGEARDGNVVHRHVAAPVWRQGLDRWRLRLTRLVAGPEAAFATSVLSRFDESRTLAHFDETLRAVIADTDVAFVEYPFWVRDVAPICRGAGVPLILSLYDVHAFAHASRPAIAERVARRELDAARLADAVFCTSREDQEHLGAHGIDARVAINPIDIASCRRAAPDAIARLRARYQLGEGALCMFVGSRIVPNIDAAAAVERLARQIPGCTFVVAGRCAPPGRRGNLVRLGWLDGPELESLYSAAEAVVMPLSSGTGTSLKFVEALAYGKAIVATTVAARGYEAEHEVHAHVVSDLDGFVDGVRRVLRDRAYREGLETGARTLATRYDFRTVFEPYGAWLRHGRVHQAAGAR